MSDNLAKQETVDWTKNVLGLEIVKMSLSDYITRVWEDFLLKWETNELEHLPGFFNVVVKNNLFQFEKKQKCWKILSQHKVHQSIFSNIVQIFSEHKRNSSNIVWNPHGQTYSRFKPCKLRPTDVFMKRCRICKEINCKYEAERQGYDLHTEKDDLPSLVALFQGHTVTALENIRKYYWSIASMFMFSGNEKCWQKSTCPAETDPSLVFKMMNCCKLFKQDDKLHDEILAVRNGLMHSPNQRLSSEDFEFCMETFNNMLTTFESECEQCRSGKKEITELNTSLMVSAVVNGEDCDLIKEALTIQAEAITYEIHVVGRMKSPKYVLQGILKAISSKRERKTWTYDTDEMRKENEERLARDNTSLLDINKQLKDENKSLKEEVRRLKEMFEERRLLQINGTDAERKDETILAQNKQEKKQKKNVIEKGRTSKNKLEKSRRRRTKLQLVYQKLEGATTGGPQSSVTRGLAGATGALR